VVVVVVEPPELVVPVVVTMPDRRHEPHGEPRDRYVATDRAEHGHHVVNVLAVVDELIDLAVQTAVTAFQAPHDVKFATLADLT